MSDNRDEQVELYFANIDNLQKANGGLEPRWQQVPAPHTRCGNADKAKATIAILKRDEGDKYRRTMFKAVKVSDGSEVLNEFKA